MLSRSSLPPAMPNTQRAPDAYIERFLLPQPARLTTADPQSAPAENLPLPITVRTAIVECGASALRVWRNHCGLSMQSLRHRTNAYMNAATLDAFDTGNAKFCEWTVGVLAQALHVEPWLLLMAQAVSIEQGNRPIPEDRQARTRKLHCV